jgi:hypothetical protein
MLHLSLFLFFAGLAVFLWNVNLTIFKLVLSWIGLCTALYGCITFIPVFRHDSPYHTPLSLPVWHFVTGLPFLVLLSLETITLHLDCFSYETWDRFQNMTKRYRTLLVQGMRKAAEESAIRSPPEIDTDAFMWTFDCLDKDHELERFFSGLPSFRSSKVVKDPLSGLTWEDMEKLLEALIGLLDCTVRTLSTELLPAPIKKRRAMICTKAIDLAHFPLTSKLIRTLCKYQYNGPLATGIVDIVRSWQNNGEERTFLKAQAVLSVFVARTQPRDDFWFLLASNELGVPEAVLRDYAAHGDSLSLAVLIYVIRQQFGHFGERLGLRGEYSSVLPVAEASKVNIQDTSPALRHDFCALWNQIVRRVQDSGDLEMAFHTLGQIRSVYLALHPDTDSDPTQFSASTSDGDSALWEPSSYPVCNISGHHPSSTSHIHVRSASMPFVRDNDKTELLPSSLASPDLPSSSTDISLPVNESLTAVPLLDGYISLAVQTTSESRCILSSSPNPVIPHTTLGSVDTAPGTTHISAPGSLVSSPPPGSKASTSAPEGVAVEHISVSGTPDDLGVRSPTQVLDDILKSSPPFSPDSSVIRSHRAMSSPEAHSPIPVPAASRPSAP